MSYTFYIKDEELNNHYETYIDNLRYNEDTNEYYSDVDFESWCNDDDFYKSTESLLEKIFNYDIDYKEINAIEIFRRECELSQLELSEKIGVLQKDISRWETGERKPSINSLAKLSKVFECKIEDLI